MADKAPWRQEIELLQNYQKHATFTLTTSGSSAETALDLEANGATFDFSQKSYSSSRPFKQYLTFRELCG